MQSIKKKLVIILTVLTLSYLLFSQTDSRYNADLNLPFNEKAGDVNPQTGDLNLSTTDAALPGRAGMDFIFGRTWSLNQSNAFNMYYDGGDRLNSSTVEKYNHMGVGWSTTMPYIMKNENGKYTTLNLFFNGSVYEIDQTGLSINLESRSNLMGYDLTDKRIYSNKTVNYGQFTELAAVKAKYPQLDAAEGMSSFYVLELKTREKYWFREDGKLMMEQDRSGLNQIWYFYEEYSEYGKTLSKLRLVVDTVNREIVFDYDGSHNLTTISWQITKGVINADGSRSTVTEDRKVEYTYQSIEDLFPMAYELYDQFLSYNSRPPFILTSKTVQADKEQTITTKYEYIEGEAGFTFNQQEQHSKNVYIMLNKIFSNYTVDGKFKNVRCFEYDVPAESMFTRWFYNGYMEHYKISRQYMLNRKGRIFNDTRYTYYEKGYQGNSQRYASVITTGGVKYHYHYIDGDTAQKKNVLEELLIETSDGFKELTKFEYYTDRTKTLESVFRQGEWVYEELFYYTKKGNLERHTDKRGLVTKTEYDPVFSIPTKTTQTFAVDGVDKDYITTNDVNDLGQVTREVIYLEKSGGIEAVEIARYAYDPFGNMITQTDAAGNSIHTVYDVEYHTFPVKIYQDVSISSWSNGQDVHANWLTDPDSTQKVRVRSWKVFNSDGSLWIEIDNEGYAIEHYYNQLGEEVQTINPDLNDYTDFAIPVQINSQGNPVGTDFDDITQEQEIFDSFLASRQDNPGVRIEIDYQNDFIQQFIDIDKAQGHIKVTGAQSDGLGHIEKEIEYRDESGELSEYAVKEMEYDSLGRMISLTDPDVDKSRFAVTQVNGTIVKRYNQTWLVKYDDLGRKIKVIYPETRKGITDQKIITYNDLLNTVTTQDPEGRTFVEYYDWNGNMTKIVRKGTRTTTEDQAEELLFTYDKLNRKIQFTDAKGIITKYKYDERDLLIEQDYGVNSGKDIMSYNDLGQLIRKTDRKLQVIEFSYDEMGRNTQSKHYRNENNSLVFDHSVKLDYDNRGNAVRISNANLIEHYLYDHSNRVIQLDRRIKDTTVREAVSQNVWQQSSDDQIFSFSYLYNDAGMVTTMTYPDGSVHQFDYDSQLNRLQKIKEGADGAFITDFVTDFTYNRAGVVTRMDYTNQTSQTWEFDNRKRIRYINIKNQTKSLVDMQYTLNGTGDILKINNNEYTYDAFNRIIGARTQLPNTVDLQLLVEKHFGTNQTGDPVDGRTYNPDADLNNDGRINGRDHIKASFTSMEAIYDVEEFEYDKNGNRTKLKQNGDIYTYEYGVRNRLEKVYVKKKLKLKKLFAKYEYDANGNTVKRKIYEDDGVTVKSEIDFEYDTMNRLVKTTESGKITEYFYDNAGNRFIKKDDKGMTVYLRHRQIAVAMDMEIPVDNTENKGVINRYVLSGDLLAGRVTTTVNTDDTRSMEKFWYHLDHLNSTKAVTKVDGSLEVLYEYRAFGEQLKRLDADGNDTDDKAKYSYGGKELDDQTNLYYFNARYYDATIGRFINMDPVQDGTNWYVYCNNNPLNMVDPTGLEDYALMEQQGYANSTGDKIETQDTQNSMNSTESDYIAKVKSRELAYMKEQQKINEDIASDKNESFIDNSEQSKDSSDSGTNALQETIDKVKDLVTDKGDGDIPRPESTETDQWDGMGIIVDAAASAAMPGKVASFAYGIASGSTAGATGESIGQKAVKPLESWSNKTHGLGVLWKVPAVRNIVNKIRKDNGIE